MISADTDDKYKIEFCNIPDNMINKIDLKINQGKKLITTTKYKMIRSISYCNEIMILYKDKFIIDSKHRKLVFYRKIV